MKLQRLYTSYKASFNDPPSYSLGTHSPTLATHSLPVKSSRILTHSLAIYLPHCPCLRLLSLGKAKFLIHFMPGRLLPQNVPPTPTPLTAQSRTRITVSSRAFLFGYFLRLDLRNLFRKRRTLEHFQNSLRRDEWYFSMGE